jgi:hypothetical protein
MQIILDLNKEQEEKFSNMTKDQICQTISKLIDDYCGEYGFSVICCCDVVVDNELLWKAGELYKVRTRDFVFFFACSEVNDFYGTHMSDLDFVNYFEVVGTDSPVVVIAAAKAGYGEQFGAYEDPND